MLQRKPKVARYYKISIYFKSDNTHSKFYTSGKITAGFGKVSIIRKFESYDEIAYIINEIVKNNINLVRTEEVKISQLLPDAVVGENAYNSNE